MGLAAIKLVLDVDGQGKVLGTISEVNNSVDRMGNTAKTATDRMAAGMGNAESATGRLAKGFENLQGQISGLIGGFSLAVIVREAIQAALAVEKINAAMSATAGSNAAREISFVREEVKRLGLNYVDTALAYAKFSASTKNTSVEGEATRKIFVGVSEAVTALRLSGEESKGIFLALSQMMSKGKISAEELSGQLGERLPGAVKLTADAMGMTTAELLKQMQAGELMSSDVLPKLAEQLHKTYGAAAVEAAKGGQAGINRFNNALFETKAALGTAIMPTFTSLLENVIKPMTGYITAFIGGLEILAVKLAALPDKAAAAWNVIKSGEGLFSKNGLAMFGKQLAIISANEDAVIFDILKKYEAGSSAKSAADLAAENAKTDAIRRQEALAKAKAAAEETRKLAEAQAQYDKQLLDAQAALRQQYRDNEKLRNEAALKDHLKQLEFEKTMGVKTVQEYLDAKYNLEKAYYQKELQDAQAIAAARFQDYSKVSDSSGADKKMQVEAEKAWQAAIKATIELKAKLSAVEAQKPRDEVKSKIEISKDYLSAEQALLAVMGDTYQATLKQIEIDNLSRKGMEQKTKDVLAQVDAIKKVKAAQDAANELKQITNRNEDLNISMIDDPYARKQAEVDATYKRERDLIQQKIDLLRSGNDAEIAQITSKQALIEEGIKREFQLRGGEEWEKFQEREKTLDNNKWNTLVSNAKSGTAQIEALQKLLATLKVKHDKDTTDNNKQSFTSQIAMMGNYVSLGSELFAGLASAQDQSSRAGFESAKNYSLGAAVMSTAAAVIGQLTGPDAWTPAAWARSAVAGILGAIQVVKIASTSFGGGSAASASSVPSGSFSGGSMSGGTVGGSIGTQYNSVHDNQSLGTLKAISTNTLNTSLAIGDVADGLTKVADLFTSGSFLSLLGGSLTTSGSQLTTSNWGRGQKGELWNPNASIKSLFSSISSGFNFAMRYDPITSAVVRSIFGGGWNTTGVGVSLGMKQGTVSAANYVQSHKDGGWFSSDQDKIEFAYNKAASDAIQVAVDSIKQTIVRSAAVMTTTVDTTLFNMAEARISTAGRTADDINADIQAWLESAANEMAKNVVGLKDFAFYGENAFDALVRLSTALQSTNEGLELIGASLIGSTMAGANAAYKLQELMGGSEEFADAIDNYFTGMFTDSEQATMKSAQAQRQMTVAFAEMGHAVPATKDQFRALVSSLDVATISGAQMFAALMSISSAATLVYDQIEELQNNQLSLNQDVTSRMLRVNGDTTSADIYELQISQAEELRDAQDKGLDVTMLLIVQALEMANAVNAIATQAAAKIEELQKSQLALDQNVTSRRLKATGETAAAVIYDLQISQAEELQSAQEKGISTTELLAVQALEMAAAMKTAASTFSDAQQTIIDSSKTALNDLVSNQSTILDTIKSILSGSLSGLSPEAAYQQAQSAFATADSSSISAAATALLEASKAFNGSTPMYQADLQMVLDRLGEAAGIGSNPTLDAANTQIDKLESIRKLIEAGNMSQLATVQAGGELQVVLTSYLATYQSALATNQLAIMAITGVAGYASGTAYVPNDMFTNIHQGEIVMDRASADVLRKYGIPSSGSTDNRDVVAELKKQGDKLDAIVSKLKDIESPLRRVAAR